MATAMISFENRLSWQMGTLGGAALKPTAAGRAKARDRAANFARATRTKAPLNS